MESCRLRVWAARSILLDDRHATLVAADVLTYHACIFGAFITRSKQNWLLQALWLRSSRQQGAVPGVRHGDSGGRSRRRRGGQMKRRLFNLLAAVSLLLALVVVAAWIRSYFDPEVLTRHRQSSGPSVFIATTSSSEGVLALELSRYSWSDASLNLIIGLERANSDYWEFKADVRHVNRLVDLRRIPVWLRWNTNQPIPDGSMRYDAIFVAYWFPFVLLMIVPVIWANLYNRALIRRLRYRRGLCGYCGYDLRASKERCPECGTAIPAGAPRGKMLA
jgi:hypothetical protein